MGRGEEAGLGGQRFPGRTVGFRSKYVLSSLLN